MSRTELIKEEIKELRNATLYMKILLITHELKSIKQDKTKGVPYKITSWNSVHDAIKRLLLKHEIVIVPKVLEHTREGNLTTVKVSADIVHASTGEKITVGDYVGYGVDTSDKGCGKAITYAYKYLLMKLFMMEVGSDEDSEYSNPPAITNTTLGRNDI